MHKRNDARTPLLPASSDLACRRERNPSSGRSRVLQLDRRSGELQRKGLKVNLQDKPFQILTLLIERAGEVVIREELQHRLWPNNTFVEFDSGLNTAVKKLRIALGDSADNPRFIETLPKRGYRLIAEVREISEDPDLTALTVESHSRESVVVEEHDEADRVITPALEAPRKTRLWFWLAGATLAAALIWVAPSWSWSSSMV